MATTINPSGAQTINPLPQVDFGISQTPVTINNGDTPTPLPDEDDRQMAQSTGAEVLTEAQVLTSLIASFRSGTPNIATVDNTGRVGWVSNGQARIIADGPTISKSVLCSLLKEGGQTTTGMVDYLPGSLAHKIAHDYDAKILGTTRAINGPGIVSWSPPTRNTLNWALQSGVDMSPITILNENRGVKGQLTLISPIHAIGVDHDRLVTGTWLQWLAVDGTNRICQRTIQASVQSTYSDGITYQDTRVYLLDSPVDSFISYVKVLPPDYPDKFPSVYVSGANSPLYNYYLPLLVQDQKKYTNCEEWYGEYNLPPNFAWTPYCRAPVSGDRAQYQIAYVGGDSGSPRCLIEDNKLVLHSLVSGTIIQPVVSRINLSMTELGGGYQCVVTDLSSYPSYP